MVKELKCKNQTVQYISESGQLPDNQHGLNEVTDPKMLFAVNPANVWDALIMKFWDDTSTDVLNNWYFLVVVYFVFDVIHTPVFL